MESISRANNHTPPRFLFSSPPPGSGVVTSQLRTTARSYLKLRWCLLPLPLLLWRNRAYKASTRKELRLLEEPRPGLLTAFVIFFPTVFSFFSLSHLYSAARTEAQPTCLSKNCEYHNFPVPCPRVRALALSVSQRLSLKLLIVVLPTLGNSHNRRLLLKCNATLGYVLLK